MADKYCDNCHYYKNLASPGGLRCCHYLLMTDKKRPCEPGEGCTVKVAVKVNRRKGKTNGA